MAPRLNGSGWLVQLYQNADLQAQPVQAQWTPRRPTKGLWVYTLNISAYAFNITDEAGHVLGFIPAMWERSIQLRRDYETLLYTWSFTSPVSGATGAASVFGVWVDLLDERPEPGAALGFIQPDVAVNIDQWGGTATTLGQKALAGSVPVALASDQGLVGDVRIANANDLTLANVGGLVNDGQSNAGGLFVRAFANVLNGTTFDNLRSASAANLAAQSAVGAAM